MTSNNAQLSLLMFDVLLQKKQEIRH